MRSRDRGSGLFACALALCACADALAADAPSLAMVTDVSGTVELRGEGKVPPLVILQELAPGAQLRLDRGERATLVYLDSGQAFELAGPTEVRLDAPGPVALRGAAPGARGPALAGAGADVRIEPVKVTQAALVMRTLGDGPRLPLLSLAGTTTLETAPVLRWIAPAGGRDASVSLLDEGGRVLWSHAGDAGEIALPASVALAPGTRYTWVVSVIDADGRKHSNAGEFAVASPELRARAAALQPAPGADVSARVVYAAWLEQNDLHDAAKPWWRQLAGEMHDEPRLRVLSGD